MRTGTAVADLVVAKLCWPKKVHEARFRFFFPSSFFLKKELVGHSGACKYRHQGFPFYFLKVPLRSLYEILDHGYILTKHLLFLGLARGLLENLMALLCNDLKVLSLLCKGLLCILEIKLVCDLSYVLQVP